MELLLTKDDIISLCGNYNYQPIIVTGEIDGKLIEKPNPEDKQSFAERMVLEFVQDHTKSYIINKGADTGRETAKVEAETKAALTTIKAGKEINLK